MNEAQKEVIERLLNENALEYGATIPRQVFIAEFGISLASDKDLAGMPVSEIRDRIRNEELRELSAADAVRHVLLGKGKFFYRCGDVYRVALPSENATYADRYLQHGKRKITKAQKLLSTTPAKYLEPDNALVRASRIKEAEKRARKRKAN
jgi:hypothetical protein